MHRTVLVPTVLLAAAGSAFAGLAIVPAAADDRPVQRMVAAAASTPLGLAATDRQRAVSLSDRDTLSPTREAVTRAAAEAARLAERAAADKAAADKAAADKAAADKAAAERASRDRDAPSSSSSAKASGGYARPGIGRLTSGFGRRWGRLHAGIDLASGVGSPISAAAAGTVTSARQESGYGNAIRIRHADGTETLYGHLSRILVSTGESVAAGEQIAKEGNTGRSTGPHLHFEVHVGGSPVNPLTWLRSKGIRV